MKKHLYAILAALVCSSAFSQVNTGLANGVSSKLNGLLYVITGVGVVFFTYCATIVGFKMAGSEHAKISDLKGLVIGGVISGMASSIAYYFIS